MAVEVRDWGRLPGGEAIRHFIFRDRQGLEVGLSSYGATLTSIRTPDRDGRSAEVLSGFDTLAGYLAPAVQAEWPYFGSTVGRFANRIAGAAFSIDGVRYPLAANEGANQNHGGPRGFDRAVWEAEPLSDGVRLRHISPDGDQGFPGLLEVEAQFRITEPGTLRISYTATTDAPTHVNLTSHGYFNLAGRASRDVGAHRLRIAAQRFLPIDAASIPAGAPLPSAGTPFDLTAPTRVADILAGTHPQMEIGDGLNHFFVLDPAGPEPAATLVDPDSGRQMELWTSAPGLQVYSANAFDGGLSDGEGRPFVRRQAICLEPQHFPDSPNRPDFPSTLLRPGETWRWETRLRFGIEEG